MEIVKDVTYTQTIHRRHVKITDGPQVEPRLFFTPGTKLQVETVSVKWDEGEEIDEVRVTGSRVLKNGKLGSTNHVVRFYRHAGLPEWLEQILSKSVTIKV